MSEQIDIAADLGVVPVPLPEIEFLREFAETLTAPPPQIIDGILRQGCKMILGAGQRSCAARPECPQWELR
jgi:hypothetical protein